MSIFSSLRCLIAAVCVIALSGCATLSEQECRGGDWFRIGFADGQNGRPLLKLFKHAEACSGYAIAPDDEQYEKGRAAGLEHYCTPAGGLKAGQRGQTYQNVCPQEGLQQFLYAYNLGYDIFLLRRELDELERLIYHIQFEQAEACKHNRTHSCSGAGHHRYQYERTRLYSLELKLLNLQRQAGDLLLNDMARPDRRY